MLAGGDAKLQLHQVEARRRSVTGCSTCSRAFNSMKQISSPCEEELAGAGVRVADRARRGEPRVEELVQQRGLAGERRRGRLLDHLLVPALDGALARAEARASGARRRGSAPRRGAASRSSARGTPRPCRSWRARDRCRRAAPSQLGVVARHLHADAAAAGRRLHQQRIAERRRLRARRTARRRRVPAIPAPPARPRCASPRAPATCP